MLKIGEAAASTGIGAETIRYYEQIGVLPPPLRAANGYRLYGDAHVRRLRFIRRCRELGFSLGRVRSLLSLADAEVAACGEVRTIAATHLADVKRNLEDLHAMARVLEGFIDRCANADAGTCPILEELFDGEPWPRSKGDAGAVSG